MVNEIKKIYFIHFSPSGSTKKIGKIITSEIKGAEVEEIDLLPSHNREKNYNFGPNDLVIFGSMTAGKLFTLSEELFACLHADNTPFIGFVTYGNGYYGIALKEMYERAISSGFKVTALGAFIAQYSIIKTLAAQRPDESDIKIIKDFAKKSYEKVLSGDLILHDELKTGWGDWETGKEVVAYREKHPEVPYTLPSEYKSKEISNACIKCGTCVKNCPTDAIDIENKTFDLEKCIACWGCINRCPKQAIKSTSKEFADIVDSFVQGSQRRQEPELFF